MRDAPTRADITVIESPPDGNRARLFSSAHCDGTEFLAAYFASHRYALHAHETYVIGGINKGCGTIFIQGAQQYANTGDLTLYNPEVVHDGGPGDTGGFGYRVSYPSLRLLEGIAREVSSHRGIGTPCFKLPIVSDAPVLSLFTTAHRSIERGEDSFEAEQLLFSAYATMLVRYAAIEPAAVGRERGPIVRAKKLIDECCTQALALADVAAQAGLSRYHFIRAFRRETGFTPHAYLLYRRIALAKHRLRG